MFVTNKYCNTLHIWCINCYLVQQLQTYPITSTSSPTAAGICSYQLPIGHLFFPIHKTALVTAASLLRICIRGTVCHCTCATGYQLLTIRRDYSNISVWQLVNDGTSSPAAYLCLSSLLLTYLRLTKKLLFVRLLHGCYSLISFLNKMICQNFNNKSTSKRSGFYGPPCISTV